MLNLSESAASELRKTLDNLPQPRPRLRVFVDHRCHCGAVHFSMNLEHDVLEGDQQFDVAGVPFVADPETVPELSAVEIDYTQDWMRKGFTIRNTDHNCGGHA